MATKNPRTDDPASGKNPATCRSAPARSAPMSSTSARWARITASSRSILASWPRRAPRARSPTSTAMPACCCIGATRSSSSPSTAPSSRSPTCCSTATCRTRSRIADFTTNIQRHTMINESLLRMYNGFHYNAHPMAQVSGDRRVDVRVLPRLAWTSITRAIARSSRIASSPRSRRSRRPPTSIRSASPSSIRATTSTTAATCCTCSTAVPCEPYHVDPLAAEALDLLLILHADHEQNASTSTVRLAGSTGCNPYSAISAGVSALWGPAHGGANEAVLEMLESIGTVDNIPKFLDQGEGQGEQRAPDGLRPSRLQELRSAREDHPRDVPRVLAKMGRADNPLLELAHAARGDRAERRVLRRPASSTRTSTSTPASSTAR
jgi:hypothetical protein